MDALLRTANPIVPLAKVENIDAAYREREFQRSKFELWVFNNSADIRLRGSRFIQTGSYERRREGSRSCSTHCLSDVKPSGITMEGRLAGWWRVQVQVIVMHILRFNLERFDLAQVVSNFYRAHPWLVIACCPLVRIVTSLDVGEKSVPGRRDTSCDTVSTRHVLYTYATSQNQYTLEFTQLEEGSLAVLRRSRGRRGIRMPGLKYPFG